MSNPSEARADVLLVVPSPDDAPRQWLESGMLPLRLAVYRRLAGMYGRVVFCCPTGGKEIAAAKAEAPEINFDPRPLADVARDAEGAVGVAVIRTVELHAGPQAADLAARLRDRGRTVALIAAGTHHWSRFVAWDHGPDSDEARRAGAVEHDLVRAADQVIGTSDAMVGDLAWRHGLTPGRVRLVPNPIAGDMPAGVASERERQTILFAGPLVARKRIDLLLGTMAALRDCGQPDAKLEIIGDGPARAALEQRARDLAVNAVFRGWLPYGQILDRMCRCAVYTQASSLEGHPKALIEAMATGAAVVVTDTPGQLRTVRHGVNGLVMPAEPEALARAIEGLLGDADWRESLGNSAMTDVRARYSIDHVAALEKAAHLAAIESALGTRAARAA